MIPDPSELRAFEQGPFRRGVDRLEVTDPATGCVLVSVASSSIEECLAAVDAAAQAAGDWARTGPRDRSDILGRVFELMMAEREVLASLITAENGKVRSEAAAEVAYAAEFFRWNAEEAVRIGGEVRTAPSGRRQIVVLPRPIGVALLITPWNFPAAMAARKVAPALAAGWAVRGRSPPPRRRSQRSPWRTFSVGRACRRGSSTWCSRIPQEAPSTRCWATRPSRRCPSRARRPLAGRCGHRLGRVTKCSMELGGNAPFLVLANADLDVAVEAALVSEAPKRGCQLCGSQSVPGRPARLRGVLEPTDRGNGRQGRRRSPR